MVTLEHRMILASAGTGKTYALTNRFVQLLAAGAPPERIVALTFTRKAAGEFFDEILGKLARAASDAGEATRLAAEIGAPELGAEDFGRFLRAVVSAMPRLMLGTLDGFFARIVRAFPLELGLAGGFEVLQEHGVRIERARVLRQLFARAGDALDDSQREFIEAFKRATFGTEEKRLAWRLDGFLDDHHARLLEAPEGEVWGRRERVWPRGTVWDGPAGDVGAAMGVLKAWSATLPEKAQRRWEEFLTAAAGWAPGGKLERELTYVLEKVLAEWGEVAAGRAVTLKFDRVAHEVGESETAAVATVVRHVVLGELQRRLETTAGIYAVLAGYERLYEEGVRRAGRLTFADVQRLLLPATGAPGLTLEATEAAERRLAIDWRLDAKFDHWLLDEFQDTSRGQWGVLGNLIDEVMQDAERRRSFFYVGDVKQAIYAWRGGDPRLFREIFERYNAVEPGTITEGRLDASWRSGEPVVAMVNGVFGREAGLRAVLPEATATRWQEEWRDHVSARPRLGGQAVWLEAADEAGCFAATREVLATVDPLRRGLSVAVLVQSNRMANALADYLRGELGWPVVAAADVAVGADNPLAAAVLAYLQAAAHPGDELARQHVLMSPLGAVLAAEGEEAPETWTIRVLAQVHEDGFETTIRRLLARVEPYLVAEDRFSRLRGRQLAEAGRIFDETGRRDIAEFIAFAGRHVVREAENDEVVRVMTIHKSKGLGFDVVILPDLGGNKLTQRREGLAIARKGAQEVAWVLDLPPKLFTENEPTLAAFAAEAEAEAAYEKLCVFYVALTRAKRGLYLITEEVKESSKSLNFPRLLKETLGEARTAVMIGERSWPGCFAAGDGSWFEALPRVDKAVVEQDVPPTLGEGTPERARRRRALTPSGEKSGMVAGRALFDEASAGAADFGRAVHQVLAAVEWGDTPPTCAVGHVEPTARAQAEACLAMPELAEVFARPVGAARAEVWRERAFEVVLDGAWITGVFDRVVIERDLSGRAKRVTVYDFKTDRRGGGEDTIRGVAERYRGQLELYGRVAARLTGLAVERVRVEVVLTAIGRRVRLEG